MKVIQFTEYGGYDKLQIVDRNKPALQPGQLLVKVNMAAVNPVDNTLRLGGIKGRVQFPKILGNEGAGVVVEGNDEFPAGTRVIISCMDAAGTVRGIATDGVWQEFLAVYPRELMKTPANVSDEVAAAFPVGFFSAYLCLQKAGFSAGKSVLSIAVGGAVGNAGIQLAKALGASQVITTSGSTSKVEVAKKAGFDNIIDLSKETITETVPTLTGGKGVDVIIDMVGGKITGDALGALNKDGIWVGIGYSAGTEFTAKITDFVWKGIQMRGASLSLWPDPNEHVKAAGILLPLLAAGKINPTVAKVFPLEQIGEANRYLIEDRPFGKVLVRF
jgi:NADPH2:quinone reductase